MCTLPPSPVSLMRYRFSLHSESSLALSAFSQLPGPSALQGPIHENEDLFLSPLALPVALLV